MLRSLAAAGLFACVASSTGVGAFAQGAPSTDFNLWWHGESALSTFLRQPHPGVTMITPGEQPTPEARSIKANGYAIVGGIGGGSARQAQTALAGGLAALEHAITRIVASGATYIFVDEPSPAPGQSTATSPDSIAYNVKGFNIVYDYIHERYPGVMMGLTIGDDGGAALHLSMLKAGLKEDFASAEYYNSCCADTNPFAALKAQFPAIKTMILAYHTETLCQLNKARNGPWIPTDGVDIWAFWDVDNFGGWIGPEFDGSWLQNVETFASTGSVESFCVLPFAFDPNYTYEIQRKDFTHTVWDRIVLGVENALRDRYDTLRV